MFTRYYTTEVEEFLADVIFIKDDVLGDWYEYLKNHLEGKPGYFLQYEEDGTIVSIEDDPTKLFPINCSVLHVDTLPAPLEDIKKQLGDKRAYKVIQGSIVQVELDVINAKANMIEAIDKLTVTVDGLTFDANPMSRQNMADAIGAAETLGQLEITWKLADNTFATVTLSQIKTARALAIQAVGQLIIGTQ